MDAMPRTQVPPGPPPVRTMAGESTLSVMLRHVLSAVRRNLWLAIAIVAAAVMLAIVATMLDTPRYSATSSV